MFLDSLMQSTKQQQLNDAIGSLKDVEFDSKFSNFNDEPLYIHCTSYFSLNLFYSHFGALTVSKGH